MNEIKKKYILYNYIWVKHYLIIIILFMKDFINKKYLNTKILDKISNIFYNAEPIHYFVFDDFINIDLYNKVEKEFIDKNNIFNISDNRENHFISNKNIIESGDNFINLYNFFISEEFENFLELIYKVPLKKYRKIDSKYIEEKIWIKNSWVVQIYEKWDFMWWHTDIAKDMEMEKSLNKWWYEEWDKCIVTKFDEIGAFIYYIYNSDNNWDSSKGWVLEMWKIEWNDIVPYKEVFPLRNRLVIIRSSNKSYHRVTNVLGEWDFRISIQDLLFNKYAEIWKEIMY